MIYLACFAVSALFAHLANKTTDRKKFWLFSVASVAVMVLLAGLRDYSIGIDVQGYLTKARYWPNAIGAESVLDYMQYYLPLGYGEPLFALMLGVIAQWTGEFRVFLFIAHLIIITGVYIGAIRLRKQVDPALVLLIFYLFFFNHSLNGIRQYMAMAIVFAAFADIQQKKYWRYCLAVVLAMMFHTTAVLALGLLIIHLFLYFDKGIKLTMIQRKGIIVGGLTLLVLVFSPLMYLLMDIGLLNERYDFFLERGNLDPALIVSGIVVLGLAAAFYFRKPMREHTEHYDFYYMCSAAYLILLQLSLTIAFGRRIALHFGLADMVTLALIDSSQKDPKKRLIVRGGILFVALVYWLYVYVFRNASQTFPYVFCFQ